MPFVVSPFGKLPPPPAATYELLLEELASGAPEERRRAAKALGGHRHAAADLAARLAVEPERPVREAVFTALVQIGGHRTARLVTPYLRAQDASVRNGAVDALKRMAAAAAPAIDPLLADPDPDTRLLAIEVTRGWPRLLAGPRLSTLIAFEPEVNVCAAAVDVATENGSLALLPALAAARARFKDEPFLVFAVDLARNRIMNEGAA